MAKKQINVIPFKHYEPTYVTFARQMQEGITKKGWELYDSKPVWRITNLKAVVDKLYELGEATVLSCAHVKKTSYIKYHYGKNAAKVMEILATTPITDRTKIEAQGLKVEQLLMVDASAAYRTIYDIDQDLAKKWFVRKSEKLARQISNK